MNSIDAKKIILGCGNFGGIGSLPELRGHGESYEQARNLLDQALEIGISRFDTANTYGGGQSESILGEWLHEQSSSVRSRLRISTKVGNPYGCTSEDRPLSRQQIQFHLEKSLQRLGVEHIDVYYLHEPDPKTPLEETLEALSSAVKKGLIGSFGLSNVGLQEVQRFLRAAGPSLGEKLTHVQNEFHALHTTDLEELIPFLSSRKTRYVAFGPLAGGLLTGKYENFDKPRQGSRLSLRPEPYRRFLNSETQQRLFSFVQGSRLSGTTPSKAALQFILKISEIDSVIIGPRRREHYESLGLKFPRA